MLLNYQGYLAGSDTLPFTGQADMTFKIYDQPVGGTAFWEETHVDLPITKGFFNVALNSVAQTQFVDLFDGSQLYLEISVNGQTMAPRKPLSSVGYAFRAQRADTADWCSGVIGDKWAASGSDIYNTNSGKVGIGTSAPVSKLEISGPLDSLGLFYKLVNTSGAALGNVIAQDFGFLNNLNTHGRFGMVTTNAATPGLADFQWLTYNGANFAERMRLTSAGMLDVANVFYTNTGTVYLRPQDGVNEGGELHFLGAGSNPACGIDNWGGKMRLNWGGTGGGMVIDGAGNVGIGQFSPGYLLDVNGTTRTSGLVIPTGAASGYLLTSDASGNASWQASSVGAHNHLGEGWSSTTSTEGLGIWLDVNTTSLVSGNMFHLTNSGTGPTYGNYILVDGTGAGDKVGFYSAIMGPIGSSADATGVIGNATNAGNGRAYGGHFSADGSGTGTKYGIYARADGSGTLYAGVFAGNVNITGSISKGSGSFLIDHPLDPQNKTLRHNFVESPENLCLYRGKVRLNSSGEGTVSMPAYFKALTKETEATVTLTSIGRPFNTGYDWNGDCTAFTVYGDADREVSYVVMADRDDPVMRKLYKPVEQDKGNGNFTKGKLLYPEAYGYAKEMGETYEMQKQAETQVGRQNSPR